MRLSEFARAGLKVEIYSEVLAETVIFASDNALVDPGERRPIYRAAELRELVGLTSRDLLQVHLAKSIFGGRISGN